MKTKNQMMGYEAYVKSMQKIGDIKVRSITVDAEKYAEYLRRMELNEALLEDIHKQHMRTITLRRQIAGRKRKYPINWLRITTAEED